MGTRPRSADVCRIQLDVWPAKTEGQVLPAPFREVSRKVPEAERVEVEGRGAKRQGRGRGSERGRHRGRRGSGHALPVSLSLCLRLPRCHIPHPWLCSESSRGLLMEL